MCYTVLIMTKCKLCGRKTREGTFCSHCGEYQYGAPTEAQGTLDESGLTLAYRMTNASYLKQYRIRFGLIVAVCLACTISGIVLGVMQFVLYTHLVWDFMLIIISLLLAASFLATVIFNLLPILLRFSKKRIVEDTTFWRQGNRVFLEFRGYVYCFDIDGTYRLTEEENAVIICKGNQECVLDTRSILVALKQELSKYNSK